MDILILVFIFLLGLCIGSFLNVVIYRHNTGRTLGGRSKCFSCGKTLRWYELIPVISFLLQRGRCIKCHSKISWQYTLVELGTGLLFVALYKYLAINPLSVTDLMYLIFTYVIWSLLTVIFVYDLRHKIIPDSLVYLFIALSFLYTLIQTPSLTRILAGPLLFLPFFLLWYLSGGKWMGFGDAKLAAGIGWYLGLMSGISALIISFWLGALFAVAILLLGKLSLFPRLKELTMKSEIPFAPFLIIGMLIVFLYHIDIFNLSFFFI